MHIMLTPLHLTNRTILDITGPDRFTFLQGIVTQDVMKLEREPAVYSALLSPQGRFLHDFFIITHGDKLYIDCNLARAGDLAKRLTMYKLRSDVVIVDRSDQLHVVVACHKEPLVDCLVVYQDPRLEVLGYRAIVKETAAVKDNGTYQHFLYTHGVPDGTADFIPDKSIPLECGLDELNAIDWKKGCYMGQELTARTKYRGMVHKRLVPVRLVGGTIPFGAPLTLGDDAVGTMYGSVQDVGMAMIRLEVLHKNIPLLGGSAQAMPWIPGWMRL